MSVRTTFYKSSLRTAVFTTAKLNGRIIMSIITMSKECCLISLQILVIEQVHNICVRNVGRALFSVPLTMMPRTRPRRGWDRENYQGHDAGTSQIPNVLLNRSPVVALACCTLIRQRARLGSTSIPTIFLQQALGNLLTPTTSVAEPRLDPLRNSR